ncbi:hypothetical protein [Chamaesiphon sp. OTE_75_metabat_556]|nr:hypothetical protein [Chamaesiphon sp. OTE_75_metabat_556]
MFPQIYINRSTVDRLAIDSPSVLHLSMEIAAIAIMSDRGVR